MPAAILPSAPTATCAYRCPRSCARWNTASACAIESATAWAPRAPLRVGICSTSRAPAALGLDIGALAVGRIADIVVLDAGHPALVGRDGDAALDSWTFASGDGVVRDVFAGGQRVVADGRHVRRDAILARFVAAMRGLLE